MNLKKALNNIPATREPCLFVKPISVKILIRGDFKKNNCKIRGIVQKGGTLSEFVTTFHVTIAGRGEGVGQLWTM